MSFRIRTIEFLAGGREIVRDRDLIKSVLTIGRSPENDIHLPDLTIEARAAKISSSAGGVSVEATGTNGFGYAGEKCLTADFDQRSGAELQFGAYRISVDEDDGYTLLTIRQIDSNEAANAAFDEKKSFTLLNILPGRRAMSWTLALLIACAFLAVPIFSNLNRGTDAKVVGDKAWSSGALSLSHHGLEKQCTACHVKPFEAVRDSTCQSCHKDVHDHAPAVRIAGAKGDLPFGQAVLWKVAHTFGKQGPGACVDCHSEHKGAQQMASAPQQFCSSCHGALSKQLTDTKLGDASDFGTDHPQFKVAVYSGQGIPLKSVSLDKRPIENSGLIFPHRMHLDPLGGVAKMASTLPERGYGAKGLGCQDCHRPVEGGVRFKPIEMDRDCEGCHSLVYDKNGPYFRRLRHGDINQTIADLRAAGPVRPMATPMLSGRGLPGDNAGQQAVQRYFTPPLGGDPVALAFSPIGVCGECHMPALQPGARIAPVSLTQRYMTKGWFNHKEHSQAKCSDCHKAQASTSSSDILMPGIAQCRTCHMGEADHSAAVPSSCAMCHSYHIAQLSVSKPGRKQ